MCFLCEITKSPIDVADENEHDTIRGMTIVKNKKGYVLAPRTMQDTRKALTQSWKRSAGMMQHHKRSMERYITLVRKEWK